MIRKPCLRCGTLIPSVAYVSRCESCETTYQSERHKRQAATRNRDHYQGNYRSRARIVRETAEACWYCGEGLRVNDPFQADHVVPQDASPDAILLPIHRSCNIRRAHKVKMIQKQNQKINDD